MLYSVTRRIGVLVALLCCLPTLAAPVPGVNDAAGDKLANKSGKNVKQLPGVVGDVALGGGGRYLVLPIPAERKIVVFDTTTGDIAKTLPVAEDKCLVAASLDKLVVYLPAANVFQRYSLETFEREATTPSPLAQSPNRLLLGARARGPLLALSGGRIRGEVAVLDPVTLKQQAVKVAPGFGSTWRISGDGRVLASFNPNLSPQGHQVQIRRDDEYKRVGLEADHNFAGHILPGPDGRYIYTARGVFTSAGKPVGRLGGYGDGSRFCVPASEGEAFYLRIDVPDFPHGGNASGPLHLHLAGDDRPVAKLDAVETPAGLNTWSRDAFGHDRRFYLIPSAKLLVVLPPALDCLHLYRVDVDELLKKCEFDYLTVLSTPPRTAVRGQTLTYTPTAKAKKGTIAFKLESGPPGMKVDATGKLTWDVPADFVGEQAAVILTVSCSAGQEILHTFSLTLPPK